MIFNKKNGLLFFFGLTSVFLISWIVISSIHKPLVGNAFVFPLFAKEFYENGALSVQLGNEIFFVNFHTTLYNHLLALFYGLFGYGVITLKFLNYTTIIIAFFLTLGLWKKDFSITLTAFMLWFTLPIVNQSAVSGQPGSAISFLFVLLFFLLLKNSETQKPNIILLSITLACIIWSKETSAIVVSAAYMLATLTKRNKKEVIETFKVLSIGWVIATVIYIAYCQAYNIDPQNIIFSFTQHSGSNDYSIIGVTRDFLIGLKGSLIWIGGGTIILLGYFLLFEAITKFSIANRFVLIGIILGFGMVTFKGLFVPRYFFEFLYPTVLIVTTSVYDQVRERKNKVKFSFNNALLISIPLFLSAFCFYIVNDPMLYLSELAEQKPNDIIVKILIFLAPTVLAIILLIHFLRTKSLGILILAFFVNFGGNSYASLIQANAKYVTYISGHGEYGFYDALELINENRAPGGVIASNRFEIFGYLKGPLYYIKPKDPMIPGNPIEVNLKVDLEQLNDSSTIFFYKKDRDLKPEYGKYFRGKCVSTFDVHIVVYGKC